MDAAGIERTSDHNTPRSPRAASTPIRSHVWKRLHHPHVVEFYMTLAVMVAFWEVAHDRGRFLGWQAATAAGAMPRLALPCLET